MKRWESIVDQIVRDAIGDGNVSHLPGAGKPLNLGKDLYTPDDQRMAYKILKDNNFTPDWMDIGKTIDQVEIKLRQQIEIRAGRYQRELNTARRKGVLLAEIEAEKSWKTFLEEFADRVERHNKEVLLYNLMVPQSITHKQILVSEALITKALQTKEGDH